jgi:alpha-glucoside transport system substrate-binding protein
MTDYVSGLSDLDTALAEIDASWPAGVSGEVQEPTEPEGPFAVIPGGFLEQALAGDFEGTEVTVDGPFTDPDDLYFAQSMEVFEEATGITVNYVGDKEFEGRLSIAVDAGDPPDIADFPQPGLLANFTLPWRARRLVCGTATTARAWCTTPRMILRPLATKCPRPGMSWSL